MPSWLIGIIVIVALAAVALLREGRRSRTLDAWIAAHGFTRHATMPDDLNQVIRGATEILRPGPARIYGAILEGQFGGRRVVVADFEASPQAGKTGIWHTLVMTPVLESSPAPRKRGGEGQHGLPDDADTVRHAGWDLIRWRGLVTPERLDTLSTLVPHVFPGA